MPYLCKLYDFRKDFENAKGIMFAMKKLRFLVGKESNTFTYDVNIENHLPDLFIFSYF